MPKGRPEEKPCATAASRCPLDTACKPEAISSTKKADVKIPSPRAEQRNPALTTRPLPAEWTTGAQH